MTPTGGKLAPNGFDSPTSPVEVLLRVRLNPNVPVACPVRTEIDSCQRLVEPGSNAPKHHMILGIHRRSCSVLPEFPQRRRPLRDHITPTRKRRLRGQVIAHISPANQRERRHQEPETDIACGHVGVVVVDDVVYEVVGYPPPLVW